MLQESSGAAVMANEFCPSSSTVGVALYLSQMFPNITFYAPSDFLWAKEDGTCEVAPKKENGEQSEYPGYWVVFKNGRIVGLMIGKTTPHEKKEETWEEEQERKTNEWLDYSGQSHTWYDKPYIER